MSVSGDLNGLWTHTIKSGSVPDTKVLIHYVFYYKNAAAALSHAGGSETVKKGRKKVRYLIVYNVNSVRCGNHQAGVRFGHECMPHCC